MSNNLSIDSNMTYQNRSTSYPINQSDPIGPVSSESSSSTSSSNVAPNNQRLFQNSLASPPPTYNNNMALRRPRARNQVLMNEKQYKNYRIQMDYPLNYVLFHCIFMIIINMAQIIVNLILITVYEQFDVTFGG